jgi:hypothetical protein
MTEETTQGRRIVEALATDRGYTLEELAVELEARGQDIAVEGQETIDALRNPVYHSNPAFAFALRGVFGLPDEWAGSLFRTLIQDAGEEWRRWQAST